MAALAKAAREAERERERAIRYQSKLIQEEERAKKAYLRSLEQKAKADAKAQKELEKEQERLYIGLTQLSDPNKGFKPLVQARTVSQVRNSYTLNLV